MRVTINIETITRRGIFRDTDNNYVKFSADFTEEERFLIKKLGLTDQILFTLGTEDMPIHYFLSHLLKGKEYKLLCTNLLDAKETVPAVEEKFHILKDMLTAGATAPDSRTFEL
jgi:hypothetical protein